VQRHAKTQTRLLLSAPFADRHSRRPLLVAEEKGLQRLQRLQWLDADLAFPVIFSKRCAWRCPNWAALLMGYFESPCWEIKPG